MNIGTTDINTLSNPTNFPPKKIFSAEKNPSPDQTIENTVHQTEEKDPTVKIEEISQSHITQTLISQQNSVKDEEMNQNKENKEETRLERTVDKLVKLLYYLKDNIAKEKDILIAHKKEKVIYDTMIYFRDKVEKIYADSSSDSSSDSSDESSNDNESQDSFYNTNSNNSSKSEEYYEDTESDYKYDTSDDELVNKLDTQMSCCIDELKRRDNYDMIKIRKEIG
jgi:hypothetical protein